MVKKMIMATFLGLFLVAGVYAQPAWALIGYQIEPCTGSCTQNVNIYGNPSLNPGGSGNINASNFAVTVPSMTLVASQSHPFSLTESFGKVSGNIASNVFDYNGTYLFTYQYDITTESGKSPILPNVAGISPFNAPNGTTNYKLNVGVFDISSNTLASQTNGLCIGASCTSVALSTFFGNPTVLSLTGSGTTIAGGNNTPINVGVGQISPIFFVDSNALFYTTGGMFLQSSGSINTENVFVPSTPEPSTYLLYGSGLLLLTFLTFRKKAGLMIG